MFESKQNPGDEKLVAPEALVKALEETQKERLYIPPQVDAAILAQATSHLAGMRQKQGGERIAVGRVPLPGVLSWFKWAALAASLVLLASLIPFFLKMHRNPTFDAADVNHDGRVDILDALIVAKSAASAPNPTRQWDFNHDGRVDRRDAETIAKIAVKLGKGGPS